MKTLHLTNSWHPTSGGIRTFYTALLRAANEYGHAMRLVVPAAESRVEEVGRWGRIYHVEAPPAPFSPSYRILYPHRALPGGAIHRILRAESPDLIEVCDKFTMNYVGGLLRVGLLPGIPNRPAVVGLSCERLEDTFRTYACRTEAMRAWARLYLRWLYFPMADHHIAVSTFVADELRSVSDGHKVDRGVWIGPMGVAFESFSGSGQDASLRQELLTRCGGDGSTRLLLYAGRMAPEKNIPLLFGMMQILEEESPGSYRLLMVGSGDSKAQLEGEAERQAPGLVHFLGHRGDARELARLMQSCDAFVHPNPAEPFGIAPLEAMAAGLPLVAPDSGGVVTYANRDNEWLAPARPEAFARAVASVFADGAERERRRESAVRTAEQNAWPLAARQYLRLYAELHARVLHEGDFSLEPEFFSKRSFPR